MTPVLLVRHGPTEWNTAGRLQGRADTPLSDDGRALVRRWRLPSGFDDALWRTSPLERARETARLLAGRDVPIDPRLIEMHWGEFEGRTLAELRAADPDGMARREAQAADFRAPGGESPREVGLRLASLFAEIASSGRPHVLVAHRGVQRAAMILAAGWDMRAKAPFDVDGHRALRLTLTAEGEARIEEALSLVIGSGA